jgi:hypothetical protein
MVDVVAGMNKMGWTEDHIKLMEQVLGTKKMMTDLAMLGETVGESKTLHGATSSSPSPGGNLTREEAGAKRKALNADPAFRDRLFSKDPTISKAAQEERSKYSRMELDD